MSGQEEKAKCRTKKGNAAAGAGAVAVGRHSASSSDDKSGYIYLFEVAEHRDEEKVGSYKVGRTRDQNNRRASYGMEVRQDTWKWWECEDRVEAETIILRDLDIEAAKIWNDPKKVSTKTEYLIGITMRDIELIIEKVINDQKRQKKKEERDLEALERYMKNL